MRVPDSLSRCPEELHFTQSEVQGELKIFNIQTFNIEQLQLADPYLFNIRQALLDPVRADKTHLRASRLYILRDNVLHYKQLMNGKLILLLAVRRTLITEILKAFHDSFITGGHAGISKKL